MRRMDHCDGLSSFFMSNGLPYPHFVVCRLSLIGGYAYILLDYEVFRF